MMKWAPEAESAIKKVPFFVRKRVRARVEKEAADRGKPMVSLADVKATQRRYLNNMESEVRGYQLDTCFGPNGCPRRAVTNDTLLPRIQALLEKEDLLGFLKRTVPGKLRFHHEFRISIADCPNGCSQPQIKDIGILGACVPRVTEEVCSRCEACLDACRETAVAQTEDDDSGPVIDRERCINCGRCIPVCPTGTLATGQQGYRIQLGGKLGRHPRLAMELPGIFSQDDVLRVIRDCIAFYKQRSGRGERFADLLTAGDLEAYARQGRFPGADHTSPV
jgi:dissimilatory sulfite reductase (desulfoviridin) alpha/beta subunit